MDVLPLGCIPRNVLEGDADGTGHSGCRERPLLSGKGPWVPPCPTPPPSLKSTGPAPREPNSPLPPMPSACHLRGQAPGGLSSPDSLWGQRTLEVWTCCPVPPPKGLEADIRWQRTGAPWPVATPGRGRWAPQNPGRLRATLVTCSVISRPAAWRCECGAPSKAALPQCHLFVNTWLNPKLLLISGQSPPAPQQGRLQQRLQDQPRGQADNSTAQNSLQTYPCGSKGTVLTPPSLHLQRSQRLCRRQSPPSFLN